MIDIHLLKLRYEILNVPLSTLAKEAGLPLFTLKESSSTWKQWWPDDDSDPSDSTTPASVSSSRTTSPPSVISDTETTYDDEGLISPLEEGAQVYIREANIRLQVFNLAKAIHLAHKYAVLESTLLDKATSTLDSAFAPADLSVLTGILKNLSTLTAAKTGTQLALGMSDDGIPTVIIRDLTGKDI